MDAAHAGKIIPSNNKDNHTLSTLSPYLLGLTKRATDPAFTNLSRLNTLTSLANIAPP